MSRLSRADRAVRSSRDLARSGSQAALTVARRAPVPEPVRRTLQRNVLWPQQTRAVPVDRILLGSQNGLSGKAWAERTGDPLWPSRRVADGPHAQLLRRAAARTLTDDDLLASSYAVMARACIEHTGDFFGATGDRGILAVARARVDGGVPVGLPRQGDPGRPVLLAPIRDSDCYQVIDGHHRVATLAVAGERVAHALVRRIPESTPLQDLLDGMSWIGGARELYQPVSSPELEQAWTTVRRCTDRFAAMQEVMHCLGLAGGSHLDVASCYGWFVARMSELGFASEGVERDPLAPRLGELAYGLDPTRITVGDAVELLERARPRQWEVVTCFSLLHHFALGRGDVTAAHLVRLLGRATGRVLFLDSGQAHERWFGERLPEWDAAYVGDFLRVHGGFDLVVDLGPDGDGVPPYEGNYGRHLFAAVRR